MSEPTAFRSRNVCLSPEDWRLFSEALRQIWPEARYYSVPTYQQYYRPEPPDIGLSSSLFDHYLPARHPYPAPEYREWRGEAEMVFDPGWQPHWYRSSDGESWSIWPPRHPQVLFQFGRGYRSDLLNAPPHLADGHICFYCHPDNSDHFRLAAKFFRVFGKFATNRHQVILRYPGYSVISHEAKGMQTWAGFDAIRWAREDPKRALFWFGHGDGTGGIIRPDDVSDGEGGRSARRVAEKQGVA